MSSISSDLLRNLIRTWQSGGWLPKTVIAIAVLVALAAATIWLFPWVFPLRYEFSDRVGIAFLVFAGLLVSGVSAYQESLVSDEREKKIQQVEQRYAENPTETQAAWDLARVNLEKYIDRNLAQVRSIFWVLALVMLAGFGLILAGVVQLFRTPAELPPSILAAAAGVLLNFIGASFLIVYRSTMNQAKEYVTVLERINAVGMSVKILEGLPAGECLRNETTAQIAKQLLELYGRQGVRT